MLAGLRLVPQCVEHGLEVVQGGRLVRVTRQASFFRVSVLTLLPDGLVSSPCAHDWISLPSIGPIGIAFLYARAQAH